MYFRPFLYLFYLRVFLCFTCKNGGFRVFSININHTSSHVHGPKNTTSTCMELDPENLRTDFV